MDNYVITIAREYGSGGKTIGKMLADHLGIPCYDMEILRMALTTVASMNSSLQNRMSSSNVRFSSSHPEAFILMS